ncbi:MAG: hypothetical protein EOP48_15220 [Sphingobacteriales bacterium]|nr:MAG: hypothetical protein EOP48_15220 [Sphingobacteriales bacterium]
MKKYLLHANENYSAYYYSTLLLELTLLACIFLVTIKAQRGKEKKLLLSYLIALEILFLYTDLAFPLSFFKIISELQYLRSVEFVNETFGVFEVYFGFALYNLRVHSTPLRNARTISLVLNMAVASFFYYQIFHAKSYREIYRYAELISAVVFLSLLVGGVIYFIECYRKNILLTYYSRLCFVFFSYATISYLIFPLSIFCYENLPDTSYWRLLNSYHVILVLLVAVTITGNLVYKKDTETQYNTFVT